MYVNHHFVQFMIHNGANEKKRASKYKRFDDLKYHLAGL